MTKLKDKAKAKKPSKPKKVWIDKFHPNNGRLQLIRLRKLSVADLESWIKIGKKEIEKYRVKDEFFNQFRQFGPIAHRSMREWCIERVQMLERLLERRKAWENNQQYRKIVQKQNRVSPGYIAAKDDLCDRYLARIKELEAALRPVANHKVIDKEKEFIGGCYANDVVENAIRLVGSVLKPKKDEVEEIAYDTG